VWTCGPVDLVDPYSVQGIAEELEGSLRSFPAICCNPAGSVRSSDSVGFRQHEEDTKAAERGRNRPAGHHHRVAARPDP